MENMGVGATRVESKLYIKINEEADNVDFTLYVPQNCNYENAKKGALGAYEHIVRLELEAIRLQNEQQVSPEEAACKSDISVEEVEVPVVAEQVSPEQVSPEQASPAAEVAGE